MSSSTKVELIGTFLTERFRFDNGTGSGTAIGQIRTKEGQIATIKGEWDADPSGAHYLDRMTTYRFYGSWRPYTNKRTGEKEDQFHFSTFVKTMPYGRAGVVNYLKQAPHVGDKIAEALWDAFQGDSVQMLRDEPHLTAEAIAGKVHGFTVFKALMAADYLKQEKAMEGCTIDLIDALAGRGFPKTTARAAVSKWGNRAAEIIKRCPYYLMAFRGCGFLKTDAMYLDLGKNPGAMRRQALCAWHFLATESSGDTWQPVQAVEKALREKIGGAAVDPVGALRLAKRARMIATKRDTLGNLWIAEKKDADHEERIAQYLLTAREHAAAPEYQGGLWPSVEGLTDVSEHQRDQLARALTGSIAILGGAPGTGKTFTAAALLKMIAATVGISNIAAAAPTGKAAVRVTENLQRYGVPLIVKTIHSLLGVKKNDATDGWSFQHRPGNPLPFRVVVIDEASMIDNGLMCSFLSAVAPGTLVLFVGDINQLPPVGRGAPLRDMIAAGIPAGTLTEIRRNSGAIVRACHAIKDGKPFQTSARIDVDAEDPENLKLVQAGAPEHQIERMFAGIEAGKTTDGLDSIWDCQVLVGVNAKSKLSRKDLNRILQEKLNATGQQAPGNPFRVGDKIVCLKNGFVEIDGQAGSPRVVADLPGDGSDGTPADIIEEPETDGDGKVYVANGELAEVLQVEEKLTVARLSNPPRIVKIPRGAGKDDQEPTSDDASSTGCNWDLGYALSVHKSQGSEWPLVIVMLDEYPGARMVCSREWLYTAISRAKRLCLMVGKMGTAVGMCRKEALGKRKTFLVEEIRKEAAIVEQIREGTANA